MTAGALLTTTTATTDVEVVAVRLSDVAVPADLALLSADERERAARFRFSRDRGRYVSGRASLRRLLGERIGVAPAEIEFAYAEAGKPYVPGVPVHFNVSHSDDVAVIAFGEPGVGALGVDIELPRPGFGGLQIAAQFFASGEVERLLALPAREQDDAFLRCWTRKEALLKAHGGGLSLPLHDFEVSLEPGEPAAILEPGPALAGGAWQLYDVSACWPGSHAAVAVDSTAPATVTTVPITAHLPEGGNP